MEELLIEGAKENAPASMKKDRDTIFSGVLKREKGYAENMPATSIGKSKGFSNLDEEIRSAHEDKIYDQLSSIATG